MLYEDFTQRLNNLCCALGFSARRMREKGGEVGSGMPELSWRWTEKDEAVIFLSCRVPYNLNWGGYCGHPQLLVQTETGSEEQTPAAFIAPYLQQYRFAQQHVFLGANGQGEHFITSPASLLDRTQGRGRKLVIEPAQVARPDKEGNIVPFETAGPMRTFALSDKLRRELSNLNFAWAPGRSIPIGRHLGSELFTFVDAEDATDRDSLLGTTLLPYICEIVSHPTPNLRAAELHLGQIFTRTVAALNAEHTRHNVLCLAGLDIDMSNFMGRKEHCFVPWRAYLARQSEALFLEQDDLFVRLMQEQKER